MSPVTSAGPNQRAGFIAAPVAGPAKKMSPTIAMPIGRPATIEKVPRESTATPMITIIRMKVATASIKMPLLVVTPSASAGTPPRVPNADFRTAAAAAAPIS